MNDSRKDISRFLMIIFAGMMSSGLGCGRASNPKAPENFAPGPVQFLSAAPAADSVTISWGMPLQTAGGEALKSDSVVSFIVRKGEVIPDQRTTFEEIGEVVVVEPKVSGGPTITKLGDSGEPQLNPLSSALGSGDKKREQLANRVFRYTDKDVHAGVRYNYQVVGVNGDEVPGEAPKTLRVTFNGETSKIEMITKADTGASSEDTSFSY